jgi:c-di-GMP-binding flagellar brake protein YcgR
MIEQRRYARFFLEHDTFAAFGQEYNKVGKVIDMSIGGLSLEYIVGENIKQNPTKIDIFSIGDIFHLYNMPCKIIYEITIHEPHVNNSNIEILTTKRCGLKFKNLSENAYCQLKLFVENNSIKFLK